MKKLIIVTLILICFDVTKAQTQNVFITNPYLQIGKNSSPTSLTVMFHAKDNADTWAVEWQENAKAKWIAASDMYAAKVVLANAVPMQVYRAMLTSLPPGSTINYRVKNNNKVVFTSTAKTIKNENQPYKMVVFGDIGAGTKEAKQIANGVYKADADMIMVTGDIVYEYGLVSDYNKVFWPIYNADKVDEIGVPLIRTVPMTAAVGNHDADSRNLDKQPDALAYYHFWDLPLNGPIGKEGGAFVPELKGSDVNKNAFFVGAGERYPRMTNYSFNYGNAHWTVLDADTYVDWTDSTLKAWVAKDLEDSKNVKWHFVSYHHPGFNSSIDHFEQQQMRLLAPIFEKGNVDIVFNGHVHNYQRSFPMQFKPDKKGTLLVGGKEKKTVRGRTVAGLWTIDKTFDGKTNTKPNGVIYIVTGAGGQKLYNPEQNNNPDSWQKFTDKFVSNIHSFTIVDVIGNKLKLKQVDANGKEIDAVEITK